MTHLVDKDVLIAEIEKWRDEIKKAIFSIPLTGSDKSYATFEYEILGRIKDFIDTLEVKDEKPADVFIDKACELLAKMIWEVTYEDLEGNSVQHYDKMEFIEDFKNYMKGE